jgi:hypothetical protein
VARFKNVGVEIIKISIGLRPFENSLGTDIGIENHEFTSHHISIRKVTYRGPTLPGGCHISLHMPETILAILVLGLEKRRGNIAIRATEQMGSASSEGESDFCRALQMQEYGRTCLLH